MHLLQLVLVIKTAAVQYVIKEWKETGHDCLEHENHSLPLNETDGNLDNEKLEKWHFG